MLVLLAAAPREGRAEGAASPDPAELVDVTTVIPDVVLDIRYATTANFTGAVLYPHAVCKLRRAVAERLARAAARLRTQDRRLLIWDCYRPRAIQALLWERVPDPRYVAPPKVGSRHNRGAAIDLGLADAAGAPVVMPTAFDEFSRAAHRAQALVRPRGLEAGALGPARRRAGFRRRGP